MKIYNEIVIDMNPESSSFEKVLHEDSFEYSGDMMLMQDEGGIAWKTEGSYNIEYKFTNGEWVKTGKKEGKNVKSFDQSLLHDVLPGSDESTEWGAESISKADFVDPQTGQARTVDEIYANLDSKLPGKTGDELKNLIRDMAPKYTEDVYGMGKEKEFAKQAYEQDIYGLQAGARKVGGAMRSAYGGTGSGMRAGIGATGALGTKFGQAGQEYGKSMYDIEQAGIKKYEDDITGWLDPEWFKAEEGGYVKRDKSGITNDLEETFLEVLTKLPDAGGS